MCVPAWHSGRVIERNPSGGRAPGRLRGSIRGRGYPDVDCSHGNAILGSWLLKTNSKAGGEIPFRARTRTCRTCWVCISRHAAGRRKLKSRSRSCTRRESFPRRGCSGCMPSELSKVCGRLRRKCGHTSDRPNSRGRHCQQPDRPHSLRTSRASASCLRARGRRCRLRPVDAACRCRLPRCWGRPGGHLALISKQR